MSATTKRALAAVAGLALLALSYYSATTSIDVEQLRVVGAQVLQGDYHLYPPEVYDGRDVHPHGFGYAPALAFLVAPLARIPLEAAAFLIFWLKIPAIVHIVVIVSRLLGVERKHWMRVGGIAFLATGGYVLEEFRGGNIHFFTVWLAVLAIDLVERGRIVPAGMALALAIAAKVTPGLYLLPALLKRRVDVMAATAAALAAILLLPILVVGAAANTTLIRGFFLYARYKMNGASNEAFRGWFIHLMTANPVIGQGALRVTLTPEDELRVNAIWLVFSAVLTLVLIVMASRPAPTVKTRLLVSSAVTLVILLIAPHTQRIYFCSLFFPCVVLAGMLYGPSPASHRGLIKVALGVSFCVSSLLPATLPGRNVAFAYERLWPHAFLTLGLLGLTVVLHSSAHETLRTPRQGVR